MLWEKCLKHSKRLFIVGFRKVENCLLGLTTVLFARKLWTSYEYIASGFVRESAFCFFAGRSMRNELSKRWKIHGLHAQVMCLLYSEFPLSSKKGFLVCMYTGIYFHTGQFENFSFLEECPFSVFFLKRKCLGMKPIVILGNKNYNFESGC